MMINTTVDQYHHLYNVSREDGGGWCVAISGGKSEKASRFLTPESIIAIPQTFLFFSVRKKRTEEPCKLYVRHDNKRRRGSCALGANADMRLLQLDRVSHVRVKYVSSPGAQMFR